MKIEFTVEELKELMKIKTPSAGTLDVEKMKQEIIKTFQNPVCLEVLSTNFRSVLNNRHLDKEPDQ